MSTDDELPTIDLNALVRPVARIHLDDADYDVLPIQGDAITVFEKAAAAKRARAASAEADTEEERNARVLQDLDWARRIVYAVCPQVPRERVGTMMIGQLMAIAEMSVDPVRRVQEVKERAEGKDGGPA